MKTDASRPGAFSPQRHVVSVSSELLNIPLDPVERHQLIEQSHVARSRHVIEAEEAERADAVANGDDDDVIHGGEYAAVVEVQSGRAAVEPAPKDPDEHGELVPVRAAVRRGWDPETEVQAILADLTPRHRSNQIRATVEIN